MGKVCNGSLYAGHTASRKRGDRLGNRQAARDRSIGMSGTAGEPKVQLLRAMSVLEMDRSGLEARYEKVMPTRSVSPRMGECAGGSTSLGCCRERESSVSVSW